MPLSCRAGLGEAITSLPSSTGGMAWSWIGVGVVYPSALTPVMIFG